MGEAVRTPLITPSASDRRAACITVAIVFELDPARRFFERIPTASARPASALSPRGATPGRSPRKSRGSVGREHYPVRSIDLCQRNTSECAGHDQDGRESAGVHLHCRKVATEASWGQLPAAPASIADWIILRGCVDVVCPQIKRTGDLRAVPRTLDESQLGYAGYAAN